MLGVPGYAEATFTPASKAPRAIASFPESSRISSFCAGTDTVPPAKSGIEYQIYDSISKASFKSESCNLSYLLY